MDLRSVVLLALTGVACRASEASRAQSPAADSPPPAIAYEDHLNAGGVKPPGGRLKNPLSSDSATVKTGERNFTAMNCDGCHGGGGLGWVGPSLVDGRWRYGGADGEIFHSIYYGRPRGMPAYGGILSSEAIWQMVTYLRAQPVPKAVPTQSFR